MNPNPPPATPASTNGAIAQVITDIANLPADWHLAGTTDGAVLRAIARHAASREILSSMETGAGKTTLLFSHLSRQHKVFAVETGNNSISVVRDSPLFHRETVEWVEGRTQTTLPQHRFEQPLQLALLDGPHGYPFPELEYYYVYPHLATDALLIVDDIHIPTIHRLFEFLKEEEMFRLLEVVGTTAFFARTEQPLFDPLGDGWWLQGFNKQRFPVDGRSAGRRFVSGLMPEIVKQTIRRLRKK